MKLPNNKTIDTIVLIAAFWSAIIVGITTFLIKAWRENDVNDKIRIFIHQTSTFIAKISNTIATETAND
jgi:hypothetical protein